MVFTMKDEDIKKSEFEDVAKGLSHSGKVRSAVFLGTRMEIWKVKFQTSAIVFYREIQTLFG